MKVERSARPASRSLMVHVDAFEAGAVEGGGHLVLAVDALLAQNGDARFCDDEIGHARSARWGREKWRADALGEIEGDVDEEAGAVGVVEEIELLLRAGGVVAEGGDVEAGFGPDLVKRGARVRVDDVVRVAEGELVGGGGARR